MSDQQPYTSDSVDAILADWREGIQCSDEQLQRMLSAVLPHIDHELPSKGNRSMLWQQSMWIAFGSLAATLLIVLGTWQFLHDREPVARQVLDSEELGMIAFTPQELHQDSVLICEMTRLFEKPVLVTKRDFRCDIDDDPYVADTASSVAGSQRVVLRCVLQELGRSKMWKDVFREEIIGGRELHLSFSNFVQLDVKHWSHLLPNNSLWTELLMHSTSDESIVESERQHVLLPNEPMVVWQNGGTHPNRRLLMVFELLPSCDQGETR